MGEIIHGTLILAVVSTKPFYERIILSSRLMSENRMFTDEEMDDIIFSKDVTYLMDTEKANLPKECGVYRLEVDIHEIYYPPTMEEPEDFDYTFHVMSSVCLATTEELYNEFKIPRISKKRARTYKSANRKWKVRKRRN